MSSMSGPGLAAALKMLGFGSMLRGLATYVLLPAAAGALFAFGAYLLVKTDAEVRRKRLEGQANGLAPEFVALGQWT